MTNFKQIDDKMQAVMGELVEMLLPYASPEVQAQYAKEQWHKCRGCDGDGVVTFLNRMADPYYDHEVTYTCAECLGDGEVNQELHDEQHEYEEKAFHQRVACDTQDLWNDIETDGYL